MYDLSLHQIIIRLGALLIIVAIHGFALAALARLLGDRGPQYDERLTPNPLTHLDLIGAAAMIMSQIGWIRPMAIDPAALRLRRIGLILCVIGSLAVMLVVVQLLLGLRIVVLNYLSDAIVPTVIAMLNASVEMSIWFAAVNLLPLPPLTGAQFLVAARPGLGPILRKYHTHAAVAFAVLLLLGVPQRIVQPVHDEAARFLVVR